MYKVVNYVDCTESQLRDILVLRNLDSVRQWMVNPEPIPESSHFSFVESLRGNRDRLFLAIYKKGSLIGTYNLSNEGDGVWERGIIASPATQGRGETAKWESQILKALPKLGINALSAKVKEDNLRSVRYHEKLGFREQYRSEGYIHYLLELS